MKLTEFNRLKKFMMLATSDNDHEALTAFRSATRIVQAHGYTWADVMDRRCTVLAEVEAAADTDTSVPGDGGEPLDDQDFDLALSGAHGSFRDTLLDIYKQWQDSSLSPRQIEVVRNAAERAAERHPGGRIR